MKVRVFGSASQKIASSVSASSWNRSSSLTCRALPSASEAICAMPRARSRSRSEKAVSTSGATTTSAPNSSGSQLIGAISAGAGSSVTQNSLGTISATSRSITKGSSIEAR